MKKCECGRIISVGAKRKWTFEKIMETTKGYRTLGPWAIENPNAYSAATRYGYLSRVIKQSNIKRTRREKVAWDEDSMLLDASHFNSLSEWAQKSSASYKAASKRLRTIISIKLGWKKAKSAHYKKELGL